MNMKCRFLVGAVAVLLLAVGAFALLHEEKPIVIKAQFIDLDDVVNDTVQVDIIYSDHLELYSVFHSIGYVERRENGKWIFLHDCGANISFMGAGFSKALLKTASPLAGRSLDGKTHLQYSIGDHYLGAWESLLPGGKYRFCVYLTADQSYAQELRDNEDFFDPYRIQPDMTRCYRVTAEFTIPER